MKKSFCSILVALIAASLFVSCNIVVTPEVVNDGAIAVTIIASNPVPESATKTEIYNNQPYWSAGDVIGVSNGTSTNVEFTTDIVNRSLAAEFSGTLAVGDYYAYYPFTANGVSSVTDHGTGAKVDIPANQNPTASSFDGSADVMVSKQFNVAAANPTINDLQFARLGAIVKLVLKDNESLLAGEHPSTVSLSAASPLAGRVVVNMTEQSISEPYYNPSSTVTANYTAGTKYEINGTNATWLIVAPQTLAEGSTITVAASTESFSISKAITVPAGGIELASGKVTTLNIGLSSGNIESSSGQALPFNDNFSWQTGTGSSGLTYESDPAIPSAKYSAYDWIYAGGASGVIRMSKSGETGYLTTVELDLSSAFYVHINSKYWSDSDATHLFVSVDDGAAEDITLTADYADYYINFAAATSKSKVKITTTASKRAYFRAIDVISGTYVAPPVINVTSDNPMAIDNTASSQTITYSVSHPTEAALTAVLQDPSDTWIDNIDYSTPGEVTFDVAAQGSGDPERSAVIVLSYTGAEDVEVTVNQAAGAGAVVSKTYTITWNSTNNSASVNNYTSSWSVTADGLTCNMQNWNNNQNGWSYVKAGRKNYASVATIITPSAIKEAIRTVTITIDAVTAEKINSIKLYVSNSTTFGDTAEGSFTVATGAKSVVISSPAANKYYKLEFDCASGSSNGLITVSQLVFTTE